MYYMSVIVQNTINVFRKDTRNPTLDKYNKSTKVPKKRLQTAMKSDQQRPTVISNAHPPTRAILVGFCSL